MPATCAPVRIVFFNKPSVMIILLRSFAYWSSRISISWRNVVTHSHPGIRAVPGSLFFILLQHLLRAFGSLPATPPDDAYAPGKLVRLRPGRNPLSHSFAPDTPLTASTDHWFECN